MGPPSTLYIKVVTIGAYVKYNSTMVLTVEISTDRSEEYILLVSRNTLFIRMIKIKTLNPNCIYIKQFMYYIPM